MQLLFALFRVRPKGATNDVLDYNEESILVLPQPTSGWLGGTIKSGNDRFLVGQSKLLSKLIVRLNRGPDLLRTAQLGLENYSTNWWIDATDSPQ